MRLYDKIVSFDRDEFANHLRGVVDTPELLRDIFDHAVRINIDNVADYIYSTPRMLTGFDLTKDVPSVAGPFRAFWMEWRVPTVVRHPNTGELLSQQYHANRFGVLYATAMPEDDTDPDLLHTVVGWMFGDGPHGLSGPFCKTVIRAGQDGRPLAPMRLSSLVDGITSEGAIDAVGGYLATPMLAIGFMHCKNVVITDAPDTRTRQQRRYDERKGTKPTEFKTLVIEPMKQVLKTEGGIEQHGLKKALHICRGHFATYSEDRPLFGKYSGTFWKPAHVRGSADIGMVGKDYKVKAPKQEAR